MRLNTVYAFFTNFFSKIIPGLIAWAIFVFAIIVLYWMVKWQARFKWKLLLSLSCLSIFIAGYFIWNSDAFQREMFPKRYWAQRVADLESSIETTEWLVRNSLLEVQKKRIEVAQAMNDYISMGSTQEEAKILAKEEYEHLGAALFLVKEYQEDRERYKQQLNEARQNLIKNMSDQELLDIVNKR